jgi:pimeloyl-ACP methyl ester carboxylesterase
LGVFSYRFGQLNRTADRCAKPLTLFDQHYTKRFGSENASEALLCLHGSQSHSGWLEEFAEGLVERADKSGKAMAVVCYDRSGFGRSEGARGRVGPPAHVCFELESIASRFFGGRPPLHLLGVSWGGLLALFAALNNKVLTKSVHLVAPGIFPHVGPNWRKTLANLFLVEKKVINFEINPSRLSSQARYQTQIKNDPLRNQTLSLSFLRTTWLMQRQLLRDSKSLPNIKNLHFYLAKGDTVIDSERTAAFGESLGAEIHWIESKGHCLIWEAPDLIKSQIIECI